VTLVSADTRPEPGALTAVELDGERVAVANIAGTLYAFADACPHRQCSLADGALDGAIVTCPCHGSQFDVTTGARLRGPAVRGVPTFDVRIEDAKLQIETRAAPPD
jgi:nitrite reductase/ring-hydroxylating ferredoxin subunit